jgi:hypothetical protein
MTSDNLRWQVGNAERALMHSAANFVGADRERIKIAISELGRYESAQQLYERARGAFGAGTGSAAAVADAAAAAAAAAVAASALPSAPPTPLHRCDLSDTYAASPRAALSDQSMLAPRSVASIPMHPPSRGAAAFAARHLATLGSSGSIDPSSAALSTSLASLKSPLETMRSPSRSHLETMRSPPSSPPPTCALSSASPMASRMAAVSHESPL